MADEQPKTETPHKKFTITFDIEGKMVDKDTPISEQALEALYNMGCPRTLKIERLRIIEVDQVSGEPLKVEEPKAEEPKAPEAPARDQECGMHPPKPEAAAAPAEASEKK